MINLHWWRARGAQGRSCSTIACLVLATLGLWSAVLAAQLPTPSGAVNDFAGVLTPDEERALTALVQEVEDATTAEIAVATVTSLDGMAVEEYATRLFEAWGVGQAEKDNGVLIVVAPAEREMRIEVGYGLEGVLPDGLAGQIIRETFLPKFRDNQYGAGIVEGTTRVAAIVRRNEPLTAEALAALDQPAGGGVSAAWVIVPFLGIFIVIGFGMLGAGLGSRAFTAVVFGLIFGGVPMLIVQAFTEGLVAWGVTAVALLAAAIGYRIGSRPSNRKSMRGTGASKSGWVWGGSSGTSGGGSSGSSSGGSSGSFGGGSSGGGGASGRW